MNIQPCSVLLSPAGEQDMILTFDSIPCPSCEGDAVNIIGEPCIACDGAGKKLTRSGKIALAVYLDVLDELDIIEETGETATAVIKRAMLTSSLMMGATLTKHVPSAQQDDEAPVKRARASSSSHKDCTHDSTPKDRAACRKARQAKM